LLCKIQQINSMAILDHMGELIPLVRHLLSTRPQGVTELLNHKALCAHAWTLIQDVAIAFFLPFDREADMVSSYLSVLLPKIATFPPHYQYGLALKYCKAIVLGRKVDAALGAEGLIRRLYDRSPQIFQLPLLFLSAHSSSPTVLELIRTGEVRYDVMTLYYSGINKLLSGAPALADADLGSAWALSKGAKDLRSAIVQALSLAAFLSGVSRPVFEARVPRKYLPESGEAAELWELTDWNIGAWSVLFQRMAGLVRRERARRVLERMARTVEAVGVKDLQRICGMGQIEDLASPEVPLRIENGIVYFGALRLQRTIDDEITRLTIAVTRGK
jgi:hypothetical protein